jgi:predicted aspartyl protease
MGMTHVDVEVANPQEPERREKLRFMVDSGALYTVVPSDVLDRRGIRRATTQRFILADGSHIDRPKGVAMFIYGGRIGGADAVFGEPGDVSLLGSTALEAMGLGLDPLKRELIQLPMLIARSDDA